MNGSIPADAPGFNLAEMGACHIYATNTDHYVAPRSQPFCDHSRVERCAIRIET